MQYRIGFVVGVALVVAPVTVEGQEEAEPETSVAEPSLSPVGVRRWHPEAFEPSPKVEYVSRSEDPSSTLITYRNRVIGSSLVAGIGVALIGGGVAALNAHKADPDPQSWVPVGPITLISLGTVTTLGGLIGAAVSGGNLQHQKHELGLVKQQQRRRVVRRRGTLGFAF